MITIPAFHVGDEVRVIGSALPLEAVRKAHVPFEAVPRGTQGAVLAIWKSNDHQFPLYQVECDLPNQPNPVVVLVPETLLVQVNRLLTRKEAVKDYYLEVQGLAVCVITGKRNLINLLRPLGELLKAPERVFIADLSRAVNQIIGKRQLGQWSRDEYEALLLLASMQGEGGIAGLLYIEPPFTTDDPERDLWFDDTRAF